MPESYLCCKEDISNPKRATVISISMKQRFRPETMEEYAATCRRVAARTSDAEVRLTYLAMADDWEVLARLRREIDSERMRKRSRAD